MKNKVFKINKNLINFSVFVLFATVLWFLNAMNKQYQTEIMLPVSFVNMPKNKANISDLPDEVTLLVKAKGYDIIKHQLGRNFMPIKFDIGTNTFHKLLDHDTSQYYILSKNFIEHIETQFDGKMKVEFLKPDTLYFHFTTFASKMVPVVVNANILPKEQYLLKDSILQIPNVVKLDGPLAILDTIEFVQTEFFELNSLTEKTSYKANIADINHVNITPNSVDLQIDIEEYTEVKFQIPIEVRNVPDTVNIHLFPNTVKVVCNVGYSNYENIKPSDFKATIDYYSIFDNQGSKIKVVMSKFPLNIYNYNFSPQFVEYIVETK